MYLQAQKSGTEPPPEVRYGSAYVVCDVMYHIFIIIGSSNECSHVLVMLVTPLVSG